MGEQTTTTTTTTGVAERNVTAADTTAQPQRAVSMWDIVRSFHAADFLPSNAVRVPGVAGALVAGSLAGSAVLAGRFVHARRTMTGRNAFLTAGNWGVFVFLSVAAVTWEYQTYQTRVVRAQLIELAAATPVRTPTPSAQETAAATLSSSTVQQTGSRRV